MVAMVSAGFCFAGFALLLSKIVKKAPKWLVPAAAGLGMISFQVYSEYTWFAHSKNLLPKQTVVVAEVGETAFYKPWTYVVPQVLKFVAADTGNVKKLDEEGSLRQVQLYFFERRMSAYNLSVLVDCAQRIQADALAMEREWGRTAYTGKLADAVCR